MQLVRSAPGRLCAQAVRRVVYVENICVAGRIC